MSIEKVLRQKSRLIATIEEAEDSLSGISCQDYCLFGYIEPEPAGKSGYRVISFHRIANPETARLSAGQEIVHIQGDAA